MKRWKIVGHRAPNKQLRNFLVHKIANGARTKRQSEDTSSKKEESFEQELCKDKDAGEWFRLVAGEGDNCRDVIQCTSSVRHNFFFIYYLFNFLFFLDNDVRNCFIKNMTN